MKALLNSLLWLFDRKIVSVRFFGWHSGQYIGEGKWRVGRLHWPDEMSNIDYFMRINDAQD